MSALRIWIVLLSLLSGGLAHASYSSFDNAPRASDEVLDRMRGGFVVSWNGLEFLLPFSISGIERLTQINGQTYINGELMTAALNPRALAPFQQALPVSVNVPAPVAAADGGVREDMNASPVDPPAQTASAADTVAQTGASGVSGTPGDSVAGASAASGSPAEMAAAPADSPPASEPVTPAPATQVSTNGSLIVIQNGVANAVVLPPNVSLDSLATFIQNSVNNQVIRNITTLSLTVEAQMLAMQARLNAIHNQSLNGLR
ncbi:hypothetical protein [Thiobacillus sp.]|uniref:hypothetical protein n=1 Tax=Thiobacillus sp. TaxID=924 RepID=UPI0025F2F11D|nr:hypothetical protein [Thiobacillus sp.]MBT9538463.1 hypothetical protein [Thiobacillus sp.]